MIERVEERAKAGTARTRLIDCQFRLRIAAAIIILGWFKYGDGKGKETFWPLLPLSTGYRLGFTWKVQQVENGATSEPLVPREHHQRAYIISSKLISNMMRAYMAAHSMLPLNVRIINLADSTTCFKTLRESAFWVLSLNVRIGSKNN